MKAPPSIERAKRRLRWWRGTRVALRWTVALLLVAVASKYVKTNVFMVGAIVTLVGAGVMQIIRRHGPRRARWIGHERPTTDLVPPVAEAFELDVPCEKCGGVNVGVEAAEWRGVDGSKRVFRTCGSCGHTQWWSDPNVPPRVRRRERMGEVSKACADCGYSLEHTRLEVVDREAGVEVYSRQCPECGRSEFYRFPAGKAHPVAKPPA